GFGWTAAPRRPATEHVKALACGRLTARITMNEGGRALALPAIPAILRSRVGHTAKGNVQAQRAVLDIACRVALIGAHDRVPRRPCPWPRRRPLAGVSLRHGGRRATG